MNIRVRTRLGLLFTLIFVVAVVLAELLFFGELEAISKDESLIESVLRQNRLLQSLAYAGFEYGDSGLIEEYQTGLNNLVRVLEQSNLVQVIYSRTSRSMVKKLKYLGLLFLEIEIMRVRSIKSTPDEQASLQKALVRLKSTFFSGYEDFSLQGLSLLEKANLRRVEIRVSRFTLMLTLTCSFGLSLAIFLLLNNLFLERNLRTLLGGVRSLGTGNLDTRIDMPWDNEFGILGRQFNVMAEELEHSFLRLREQDAELRRGTQARDRFFSIISHDLRSPLHGISAVEQLMTMDLERQDPTRMKLYAEHLGTSIRNMNLLLDNLLSWSMIQRDGLVNKPSRVSLMQVLKEISQLDRASFQGKNIIFRTDTIAMDDLYCDPDMLKTILRNLVSNGLKFTPEGGEIVVCSRLDTSRSWIEIDIKDTGVGMDPAIQDQLFDRENWVSTPGTNKEKGTGLGLVLCADLIALMGGTISVLSQPAMGTTFTLHLPVLWSQA